MPGAAEPGDRFGAAVSIKLPGRARPGVEVDAAIGAPNEDIGSLADAGAVTVVRDVYFDDFPGASASIRTLPGSPAWRRRATGSAGVWTPCGSVAPARLAVGVPGEDVGSDANAGSVQLFSSNNITLTPGPA